VALDTTKVNSLLYRIILGNFNGKEQASIRTVPNIISAREIMKKGDRRNDFEGTYTITRSG